MSFKIERGNILDYKADAIVMPANPEPAIGNGLDRLIYKQAGRNSLLKARRNIGKLEVGTACITDVYALRKKGFKWIIHTVSPAFDESDQEKSNDLLKSCYMTALQIANEKNCNSIVFPLLSTGVLKYPVDKARYIAEGACKLFLAEQENMTITLVLYDAGPDIPDDDLTAYIHENTYGLLNEADYDRAEKEWASLPQYREEREVLEVMRKQIARKRADEKIYEQFLKRRRASEKDEMLSDSITMDDYISQERREMFDEVFERYFLASGAKNYAEICRRGNLNESTLSKLRSYTWKTFNRDHIWALCVALGLSLDESEELFNSCGLSIHGGYNLTYKEEQREKLLEYGIINHRSIDEINDALYDRDMPMLGDK